MYFGRKLKTEKEKEFWAECYKIGMRNGWCNGEYERMDGNFITEEDRLNKDSVSVIDDLKTLRSFFIHGNWCLGQAIIYKNLCFIQQVNGGDEWLTMKKFSDGKVRSFESITMRPTAKSYWDDDEDTKRILQFYLDNKERGRKKEYYVRQKYFEKLIKSLIKAKVYTWIDKDKKEHETVIYADWELKEYKDKKPIAI